jgi:hypothetical protein
MLPAAERGGHTVVKRGGKSPVAGGAIEQDFLDFLTWIKKFYFTYHYDGSCCN